MQTSRYNGFEAIFAAKKLGVPLSKYADPVEGPREGLTVLEAEEIAREDASLIYLDIKDAGPKYTGSRWHNPVESVTQCPKCATETVEDQEEEYGDEEAPIYFDRCPKCGWNNGPAKLQSTLTNGYPVPGCLKCGWIGPVHLQWSGEAPIYFDQCPKCGWNNGPV